MPDVLIFALIYFATGAITPPVVRLVDKLLGENR
jgi:hypothetical protein